MSFPLASDFEPKGEVAMQFGASHPQGVCARVQLIVDRDRTAVFRYDGPLEKSAGAHMVLNALEELSADD